MAGFVKGDIVVIPFPFSDLSGSKRRPALVLSDLPGDDIILCQITSQNSDKFAITLSNTDFENGALPITSYIRPTRIFTADKNIIVRKSGTIRRSLYKLVVENIKGLIE